MLFYMVMCKMQDISSLDIVTSFKFFLFLFNLMCNPGAFTKNVVAAAPVVYCKRALESSETVRMLNIAHLILLLGQNVSFS